jgi:hypothetical protein
MPYTTNVAGTTITAAWGNANVRDQVVTPFASASARTSAVTAPLDGMVSYLQDVDIFYGYINGAWGQILDYRQGKGVIYSKQRVTASTLVTGVTTETTVFTKSLTNLEASRVYRITCIADIYNESVNATAARLKIKDGSTQIAETGYVPLFQAGFPTMSQAMCEYTTGSSQTTITLNVTLTLQGTGTLAITSGVGAPFTLEVCDVSGVTTVIEA